MKIASSKAKNWNQITEVVGFLDLNKKDLHKLKHSWLKSFLEVHPYFHAPAFSRNNYETFVIRHGNLKKLLWKCIKKNRAVPKEIISPGLLKCWNCGHIFVLQKNFHAKKTEFLNYSSSMLLKLDYTFFAISICSSYCNFLLNNEVKMFVSKEVRSTYFFQLITLC